MAIMAAVGNGAANRPGDVRVIQALLSLQPATAGAKPIRIDGVCGKGTIKAITGFQLRVGHSEPTGVIEPDSETLNQLRSAVPKELSPAKLRAIFCSATEAIVHRYATALTSGMAANEIDTPLRCAHFLAQIGHESGDLRYSEEIASGAAYEGRLDLGNTQAGDGKRFKGRGLIQLTGRANYTAYGAARNADFITADRPKVLAADAQIAVDVSAWFWTKHGLNGLADADDLRRITRKINGGYNGLEERRARLALAKVLLLPREAETQCIK